eukprot:gene9853-7743_t
MHRHLKSSVEIEPSLKNFWYPTEFSSKLTKTPGSLLNVAGGPWDTLVPFELCGEPWVLFRNEQGAPSCIKDQCAHRACPLSAGKVIAGQVQCPYHGWKFDGDGSCTEMPSTRFNPNVAVTALPCAEKDGFIWVWPGEAVPDERPPPSNHPLPTPAYHPAEIMVDVPVEHGLLIENLLDLAHAPFTHTSTFARGWPVPEAVTFHANKVHVCMPSKTGHTRLLYRMSMDFIGWMRYIPSIDKVWQSVAAQVLGEDMALITGQQDRLERGGDTWANPMPYDKLGVRYRRWRNSVADGDEAEAWSYARSAKMGAGELFSVDEEEGLDVDGQVEN